ncbi:conserved hypothetical protein [Methanocaldococcus infernus ME]|uniref:Uncharacterized protein n=1 Tax=Methanocaldococcus infernus (strain DSM 11812 / JCM 15783 / ME) TaxID=573063 RepID=D5VTF1_METIM|nr:hypothetical protein [Methanocaldococcus infernus]ADG13854.1 conserved hypothetical protein [Methanocaldococcus infernus ME]
MIEIRGKNKEEILKKIESLGEHEEIYINKELDRDIAIALLENVEPSKIYIPISKYKRSSKKILKALEKIGVEVIPIKAKVGKPTNIDKIIKKYLDKKPKEIAELTGINLKTVEYHYYKLKKREKGCISSSQV